MMKKRLLSMFLAVLTVLSLVPLTVFATSAAEAYAVLADNVLTFYCDGNRASRAAGATAVYDVPAKAPEDGVPWNTNSTAEGKLISTVESVVFDASFYDFDALEDMYAWFYCKADEQKKSDKITSITGLGNINTTNLKSMDRTFTGLKNLVTIDFGDFKASGVTNIHTLFSDCKSLKSLDLSNFGTSLITDMSSLFKGCSSLTEVNVSNFDTFNVTNMGSMFASCSSLTELDLSHFVTSKVTDMTMMFGGCKALADLNVSGFDTSGVTDMRYMFGTCASLKTLDLSSFSTEALPNIGQMFSGCSSLETVYATSAFDGAACGGAKTFGTCSASLQGGMGTLWNADNVGPEFARVDGGTSAPGYFTQSAKKIAKPTEDPGTYTYNGEYQTYSPDGFEADKMVMTNGMQKDAGTYEVKVTPADGYSWKDGGSDPVFIWSIGCVKVAKPTEDTASYTYNGTAQTYKPEGFDSALMTMQGGEQTDAGSYQVTVSLKDTNNSIWADGTTDPVTFAWTILPGEAPSYKIIKGAKQNIWTDAQSATFSSDADFSKFVRVEVDGWIVERKYYDAKSGSTVITFNREAIQKFVKKFGTGKHKLTIVSTDGSATTTFTLKKKPPVPPKTGDSTDPALLIMLLLLSAGAIIGMSARMRKNQG